MVSPFPISQKGEHSVQGVQTNAEIDKTTLESLKWDDLKLFLFVSESGSLRAAATQGRVAVNTVRTRLSRLEDKVGMPLVVRSHNGVVLTAAGFRLRKLAHSMQSAAIPYDDLTAATIRRPNELRIGASEALGSGWLTPRLLDLQSKFPELTMTLLCDNDLDAQHFDDVDIQLGWKVPRESNRIVCKLGTIHFMPFASRGYIKEHGAPRTPEEFLDHRFIEQVGPGIKSEMLDQLVGDARPPGFLPIRTNSSFSVFWAVANSAGIAFMPTYSAAIADMLVPIDLPFRLKFDIYYHFKVEARSCPLVMAGIEWLKECFDPHHFPWFRSEFIHPREFFPRGTGTVVPLFKGLLPSTT